MLLSCSICFSKCVSNLSMIPCKRQLLIIDNNMMTMMSKQCVWRITKAYKYRKWITKGGGKLEVKHYINNPYFFLTFTLRLKPRNTNRTIHKTMCNYRGIKLRCYRLQKAFNNYRSSLLHAIGICLNSQIKLTRLRPQHIWLLA